MQRIRLNFVNVLIALVLIPASSAGAEGLGDYGLQINSVASIETEATGLALDEGELIPLRRKPFTLSFSLYNSKERPFGCVLRMISEDGYAIDMMNSVDSNGIYRPQVVVGDEYVVIPSLIPWDTWIDVTVSINQRGG